MTQETKQSFDIFDTILVRTWAKPIDLFWELGVHLQQNRLIQISSEMWQDMRVKAESAARQKSRTGEVTLQNIYEELVPVFNWSSTEAEKAIALEIQLERYSLRPIPETQRRIQKLHQQKQAIAYLSDMYLPTEVIKDLLRVHKIWADGDLLYVSAEIGVGKGSGKLFQHHLNQHNLIAPQLYHSGDNLHADVNVPKKMGIQVTPFLQAHLNRYEQQISDNEKLPLRFRSLLAGVSRLCRLNCLENDPHRQTIWNTAANVIAPLIFGFVHWVLTEAKRKGIQRLYFMAKDGQILLKTAQVICRKWDYNIDCRYLYGSKQAFHFPSILELKETELNWIFYNTEFFSVRIICKRVNLQPEQIADTLLSYGFSAEKWDQNLTHQEELSLKAIFQEPAIAKVIISMAETQREKALGYFRQEGIGDGVHFATVDIGWSGKSQRSLSRLLAAGDLYPSEGLSGFFFGLMGRTQAFPTDCLMPYFLEHDNTIERRFLCDPQILKLFLAADHGSTVRYEKQNDQYTPVLCSEKNESGVTWGVLTQQQAVIEFTEQLTDSLKPDECKVEHFQQITENLLQTFIYRPSKEEAEAFGAQSFSQHQLESKFYDLAPAYTLIDGIKMLFGQKHVHSFAWLPASIHRSAPLARVSLRYIKRKRYCFTYAHFAWCDFLVGNYQKAWVLSTRAMKSWPIIWLSRRFIRMNFSIGVNSIFYSRYYKRLQNFFMLLFNLFLSKK
jgi:predicted HAD superfamily hydrolase